MKTNNKPSPYILRGSAGALLFSSVILALCSAISLPAHPRKAAALQNAMFGANRHQSRGLSFEERVAYQTAIEDVYWRHRIWPDTNRGPKPSLNAVMSQTEVEKKVEEYLQNSQALENQWLHPITAVQLQAEMERIAGNTKQPEVLQELFEALGNDPFVIAECLARPIVAERLINKFSSGAKDPSFRAKSRKPAARPTANSTRSFDSAQDDTASNLDNVAYTLPVITMPSDGCTDGTWLATSTINAPAPRVAHTAVWTGSEMIVWGGNDAFFNFDTGGKYNPSTDSWTTTNTIGAPSVRTAHTAVWTGTEMIVWGGTTGLPNVFNTGGRYNPGTGSWTVTNTIGAPASRASHTAVWSGTQMIVWGGIGASGNLNTGGRYDPSTNSWTPTTTTGAPDARSRHTAVWSDEFNQMIIWGGEAGFNSFLNTGGRYDPSTDSWTPTTTTGAPTPRERHTAVWSGSEMIVWGGFNGSILFNTGGRYNPSTNSWTATSTTGAPTARDDHTAVWAGKMIVWAGEIGPFAYTDTLGVYNPTTDSWPATNSADAPDARHLHTAVWTGSQMIVWGGYGPSPGGHYLDTGGSYCAGASSPTPTPSFTPRPTPTARPRPTPMPRP